MSKTADPRTARHEEARHALARAVFRMGFTWNDHQVEHGIDAFVELVEPSTKRALGAFVGIQIKTAQQLSAESTNEFSFYADPDDLAYWRDARIPVLLIVGKPADDAYFAVHIQQYLQDQESKSSTVRFDKGRDRFLPNADWQKRLLAIGNTYTRGLQFPPRDVPESILTNLLEVRLPERVYFGGTRLRYRADVIGKQKGDPSTVFREFIVKDGRLWSPLNLSDPVVGEGIVDLPSVEYLPFSNLAFDSDPSRRRYAVELLNLCLSELLRRQSIRWLEDEEAYCFFPKNAPSHRLSIEVASDAGITQQGIVFPTFFKGKLVRCRHVAMIPEFQGVGRQYYLQVTPTCIFTRDGHMKHPHHQELLQRLKIMQKQRDYTRGLFLWRSLLVRKDDLLQSPYPHLGFRDYLRLDAPVSIADDTWLKTSEARDELDDDDIEALVASP